MKYLVLLSSIFLVSCQSTPTFCTNTPESSLCDQKTYKYETDQALKEFETMKTKKAFAIAQTDDGWEFYGYSEGYSSQRKAQESAISACQTRVDKMDKKAKCELIR